MPSSVIRSHAYDDETRELTIEFTSGKVYVYGNVPESVCIGLEQAPSAGQFFNQHIKDRYDFREVNRPTGRL